MTRDKYYIKWTVKADKAFKNAHAGPDCLTWIKIT